MRTYSPRAALVAALPLIALVACHRGSQPARTPSPRTRAPAPASAYATGMEVVEAMHARYAGKWYSTLTFTQKTSRLLPNGTWDVQTWYEASRLPGRLRIDFAPLSAGNGVLYARDSQFVVTSGRALRGDPGINPLALLGFDVYANTPARTAALLRKEGFDLSRVHEGTFDGRRMIVVGARQGDLHRKQFWVDAERLYFVRMLEPAPRDSTKTQDIRFLNYARHDGGWVAPRVEIHSDGKLVFYEDYSDIETNVELDEALFDPARWKTVKHWTVK